MTHTLSYATRATDSSDDSQALTRLFPFLSPQLAAAKQRQKRCHGLAKARRNAKRLEAWKARKGFTEEKRGDDQGLESTDQIASKPLDPEPPGRSHLHDTGEVAGYDPRHPGYEEIATTTPVDNLPRAYHPTPRLATTRPGVDITAPTKPPTVPAASTPLVLAATSPTPDTTPLSSAELSAFFNQLEGHYAAPTPRTPEPAHGQEERTLEEVLGSPIWELELTCSPIHASPGLGPRQPLVSRF